MRIRRDVASVPARSARETWEAIVEVVTGANSVDVDQLSAAAAIMAALIGDEHLTSVPMVLRGSGPRLLIYCAYGVDAMEGDLQTEMLSWNPTAGDWRLTAPCDAADVDWMSKALSLCSPRITVHAPDQQPDDEEQAPAEPVLTIDWTALDKR
jgi:hypothetical protein